MRTTELSFELDRDFGGGGHLPGYERYTINAPAETVDVTGDFDDDYYEAFDEESTDDVLL